ncbi:MAG TPA: hypothetical protein VMT70_23300 [Vicinamibacteria bacterium]|nr:hypothetical protein [Vicinamibacteria bacterium]
MSRRLRWFQVRVHTDEGVYVGSLRLSGSRSALSELIDTGRHYLTLWDAAREDEPVKEGFVALHKAAIRLVEVVGSAEPRIPALEARP